MPEIRRSGKSAPGLFQRGRGLPQITNYTSRRQRGVSGPVMLVAALALVVLILTLAAPAWMPLLRHVIPDRYIMAYAPPGVQRMIFNFDVNEQVVAPTIDYDESAALSALDDLATIPTPTPTPTPVPLPTGIPGTPGGGSYIQPTAVPIAPTPTMTPASAVPVDSRAVDRENSADLSRVDALLTGFTFIQQTGSNNCGPASFATMMSYWGVELTQTEAQVYLKPNPNDPNVRPDEMVAFARTLNYNMIVRDNGTFEILKKFILAGYPVMIETGYDPEPTTFGWMSHFLTLVGYSEADGGFIAMDTYRRPNWFYPYEEIDYFWRQFNRRYLVAYRDDQAVAVASIIGEDMNDLTMYTKAYNTAVIEKNLNREDPFAWFNMGTSLVGLGDYEHAVLAFDQARRIGLPRRFLWYQFEPFEAYLQAGRYDDVIELAEQVLRNQSGTEEPYYYRGMALLAQGDRDGARRDLSMALRLNRNYEEARRQLDLLGDS